MNKHILLQHGSEAAIGAAMLKMAKKEGNAPKAPGSFPKFAEPATDVDAAMLELMTGWQRASEIAHLVSKRLGRTVWPQTITDRLRGTLAKKVMRKTEGKRDIYWSLK